MVKILEISDEDLVRYSDAFKKAEVSFGWTKEDAKKIVNGEKVSILFCYHPVYMLFSFDHKDKMDYKFWTATDEGKVVSFTLNDYQVNIDETGIYLIDEEGQHQAIHLLRNNETPDFEVAANGVLMYMQYDSKRDVRLVMKYDFNVMGANRLVFSEYLAKPFYVSVESRPKLRDRGLIFLGRKDAYYRLDFDVYKNRWQYDLATIQEFGLAAVLASDTVSLQAGKTDFSKYYRQLFSVGEYISITGFPFLKQYKPEDIDFIIESFNFNNSIPSFLAQIYNRRNEMGEEFQEIMNEWQRMNELKNGKK